MTTSIKAQRKQAQQKRKVEARIRKAKNISTPVMREHGWFYGWLIKSDQRGAAIATKDKNELSVNGCKDDDEALKQIMQAIDEAEDKAMKANQ